MPVLAAPNSQELHTLHAPSPRKTIFFPFEAAELFPDREQVRQDLAGMLIIGERVDHGDRADLAQTPPRPAARTCG